MTTLADRPLSEIIDLDSLEDDDNFLGNIHWPPFRPPPPPLRQPVEVIVINSDDEDNDDDDVQIIEHIIRPPSHNLPGGDARNIGAGPSGTRQRNYFSPPPPPQHNAIPPVPPLPSHLPRLGHGPNRRPPAVDAGVIRPSLHAPEFGPRTDGHHNVNANTNAPHAAAGAHIREGARQATPAARDRSPGIPGAWIDLPHAQAGYNNGNVGRMGLGGGLMTRNSRLPAGIGGMGDLMGRLRADWDAVWDFVDNPFGNEDRVPAIAHILDDHARAMHGPHNADFGLERHMYERTGGAFRHGPGYGQYAHQHAQPGGMRDYEKGFTHPLLPKKGFTHDFAVPEVLSVSDSPGPSSPMKSSPRHTLACARCKDPLVMNVKGSEEEAKKRRLWALRCGHVLDGKCVEELMQPAPLPLLNLEENEKKFDIKGKGKADDPISDHTSPLLQKLDELSPPASPSKNRKGKGRAVPLPAPFPMQTTEDNASSVRSRLRPRYDSISGSGSRTTTTTTNPASLSNILNSPSASPANPTHALPSHPSSSRTTPRTRSHASSSTSTSAALPRRPGGFPRPARPLSGSSTAGNGRRGKGNRAKGGGRKGKGGKLVVEAEFEWFCPVDGCLKEHRSVKVGGEWKGAEGHGAVPLFV